MNGDGISMIRYTNFRNSHINTRFHHNQIRKTYFGEFIGFYVTLHWMLCYFRRRAEINKSVYQLFQPNQKPATKNK